MFCVIRKFDDLRPMFRARAHVDTTQYDGCWRAKETEINFLVKKTIQKGLCPEEICNITCTCVDWQIHLRAHGRRASWELFTDRDRNLRVHENDVR